MLVVISDGGDNASTTRFEELLQRVQQMETVIYTSGLFDEACLDRNPRVLKRLAAARGGQAFLPNDPRDAVKILERIAHDIRSVHTISYAPTNAPCLGARSKHVLPF